MENVSSGEWQPNNKKNVCRSHSLAQSLIHSFIYSLRPLRVSKHTHTRIRSYPKTEIPSRCGQRDTIPNCTVHWPHILYNTRTQPTFYANAGGMNCRRHDTVCVCLCDCQPTSTFRSHPLLTHIRHADGHKFESLVFHFGCGPIANNAMIAS